MSYTLLSIQNKRKSKYNMPVRGKDGSAAMLAAKRSVGVAPEVNLRQNVTRMPPPNSNKAAHSGFETQRRRHQKSKTGVSVALQKGLMSSKKFKIKIYNMPANSYPFISLCDVHSPFVEDTCN